VKYHGRTYIEIKNGSDVATVALFGTAGLAREILGDNPITGYRELITTTVDCLSGIFSSDRACLLRHIHERLGSICDPLASSVAQKMVVESLVREVGKISCLTTRLRDDEIRERLFSATGRDLFEGLVIASADQYAMHHRGLSQEGLNSFLSSLRDSAEERLSGMMRSMFETGQIDRQFTRPRPELAPLRADSIDDLNSSLTP
jgi:hypothetical protein